jgi:hypothetical protein
MTALAEALRYDLVLDVRRRRPSLPLFRLDDADKG